MQFCVELPDKLGEQLLKQSNMQQLVQNTIENMLLEQKINSQLVVDILQELPEFPSFAGKEPLEIQKEMRDEWR